MLTLIFMLLIVLLGLTAIIWAVTFFFQGYVYTEPTPGLYWQAPVTAAILFCGYAIWVLAIALWPSASKTKNIPINTIHRFTPHEDMLDHPPKKIWAIHADRKKGDDDAGKTIPFVSKREDRYHYHYVNEKTGALWRREGVVAIEIELEDKTNPGAAGKMRFDWTPTDVDEYQTFISPEGWTIREYRNEGPRDPPVRFRFTRLLMNLGFNAVHFIVWFVALWLILRYQWPHALVLAVVMWLVVTLIFLPMMLDYAAEVAMNRQSAADVRG